MSDRRNKILAMLEDDPQDQFLRYTLAMDYRGAGEFEEAQRWFEGLMGDQEPHVAAFFMSAQCHVEAGNVERARTALRTGIDLARERNDSHAAAEMSELLASLGTAGESDDDDL